MSHLIRLCLALLAAPFPDSSADLSVCTRARIPQACEPRAKAPRPALDARTERMMLRAVGCALGAGLVGVLAARLTCSHRTRTANRRARRVGPGPVGRAAGPGTAEFVRRRRRERRCDFDRFYQALIRDL